MSTTKMRAKMVINDIKIYAEAEQESIHFAAVGLNSQYPDDGSDENNTFAKFTPSASLDISILNPALLGKFKKGDTFYVDFTPVEK